MTVRVPDCRRFWELIAYWWCKDRIRIATSEGRILRLRPGHYIGIAVQVYEILSRQTRSADDGLWLDYRCRSAREDVRISAGPVRPGHPCRIEINNGMTKRELMADELLLYESPRTPPDRRL